MFVNFMRVEVNFRLASNRFETRRTPTSQLLKSLEVKFKRHGRRNCSKSIRMLGERAELETEIQMPPSAVEVTEPHENVCANGRSP